MLRPLLSFRSRPLGLQQRETEPGPITSLHLAMSAIFLTLILSVIMAVPILPGQVQVEEGTPATQDVYASSPLRYESKVRTDKARDDAMSDKSNEVWVQDTTVVQRQRSILLHNLAVVDYMRTGIDTDSFIDDLPQRALQGITPTQILTTTLLGISDQEYRYWRDSVVLPAFDSLMRERRMSSNADMQDARASLPNVLSSTLSADEKAAAIEFIAPLLKVNVRLDEEQTKQRRDASAADIKPVIVTVLKGEAILRQGEIATPEAIEKMREAGLLSREVSLQSVVGITSIVGLFMLLLHLYIFRHESQVGKRRKQLILIGMLMVVTLLAGRLFLPGHSFLPYLLPLAAVSMLLAVLLSPNLAMLVTFILAVLLGMVVDSGFSMDLPVYYFVGGLTGIFTLTRIEKVSTFAFAGGAIALASLATALTLRLIESAGPLDWEIMGQLSLAALFNAGISTSITYAAFSLLGTLFGITTPLQLMELAHPDQPILRRLMREAPGTYHHSLVVSNLAERAAETIGCDPLLTRVCAYYHDIGKVERPFYFIDNQSGMVNVHDEMDPHASAVIIAEHVRDGIRLGQKYKVPRRVLDSIPQHHGTMLIKYFFYKAQQADPNVNPDDFRYPGPKPQTKENAILMLADGVEATVRAMAQSGALDKMATSNSDATEGASLYNDTATLPEDAIARVVHNTISERIEDGQLDECDLTVRDIARIQEAFVSMLKGIYHPRVPYPEAPTPTAQSTDLSVANGHVASNGHTKTTNGAQPLAEQKPTTVDVT